MLVSVPPAAFGYCFDPAQAVIEAGDPAGWEAALRAALPRLHAVALADVAFDHADESQEKNLQPKPRICPLGEGVIDWKKFFAMLAAARFHGPISLHMDYTPRNPVSAMNKDLDFARTHVDEAWRA